MGQRGIIGVGLSRCVPFGAITSPRASILFCSGAPGCYRLACSRLRWLRVSSGILPRRGSRHQADAGH
eukprot:3492608-Amphidinium_carterae.1